MADKLQRNVEINGLLGNHCAPSEGEVAKPESESQGRRFGNIRRVWTLGNDFHHSGQPDAVAKNRISLQVHQSNQRVGKNELKTEKNICTYVIYKDRCLYFISWVCHISLDYCRPEIIWKIVNRFSFSENVVIDGIAGFAVIKPTLLKVVSRCDMIWGCPRTFVEFVASTSVV